MPETYKDTAQRAAEYNAQNADKKASKEANTESRQAQLKNKNFLNDVTNTGDYDLTDVNQKYVKVGDKWISEEQKKHWISLSDVKSQNEYLNSLKGVSPETAAKQNKSIPSLLSDKPKVGTLEEGSISDEDKEKLLHESDKIQLKEDKKFSKDTGIYVNNTTGNAVSKDKLPEILTIDSLGYHSNDKFKAKDIFKAAKKVGWTEKQLKDRLNELYPDGWSDKVKDLWNESGYAKLEKRKEDEVKEAIINNNKPIEDKKENTSTEEISTLSNPTVTPVKNTDKTSLKDDTLKEDEKDTSKDKIKPIVIDENHPLSKDTEDRMNKSEAQQFRENSKALDRIEEQLKDTSLTSTERAKLEEEAETLRQANNYITNALDTTDLDISNHAKEREQFEKYVTKQRQKGLIPGWIAEGKAYSEMVKSAEADLEKAKKLGNESDIKEAEERLSDIKKAKKDMHQEYGMFLINALGTALSNTASLAKGGSGDQKSLYQERVGKNINAETDRWNDYKTETLKNLGSDIDKRWGENSEQKAVYNELLKDEASQNLAQRLGVLDKAYGVEAVNKMKQALGSDLKETLSTMSLLGYGSEAMIFETLSKTDIDIDSLSKTLEELAQNGLDFAQRGLDMLNKLGDKFKLN